MSTKSWIEEFMPLRVDQLMDRFIRDRVYTGDNNSGISDVEMLACIEHGLQKYSGTTKANLKKHGVIIQENLVLVGSYDAYGWPIDKFAPFGASTCALCEVTNVHCNICPLYKVAGDLNCTQPGSPYKAFDLTLNADPLRQALCTIRNEYKKKVDHGSNEKE